MRPYYEQDGLQIYHGDMLEILPSLPTGNVCIADPPYGQTALAWDHWPDGWVQLVKADSLWCFGTMKMFLQHASEFMMAGFSMSRSDLGKT